MTRGAKISITLSKSILIMIKVPTTLRAWLVGSVEMTRKF